MRRVYIAAPISRGDLLHNIRQADHAFCLLAKAGLAPWNPVLSVYAGAANDAAGKILAEASRSSALNLAHDEWLNIDLEWVAVANAVLRLPGESGGADQETAHARKLNIPVFDSIEDVIAWSRAMRAESEW